MEGRIVGVGSIFNSMNIELPASLLSLIASASLFAATKHTRPRKKKP